jgi:hypothetical protein
MQPVLHLRSLRNLNAACFALAQPAQPQNKMFLPLRSLRNPKQLSKLNQLK